MNNESERKKKRKKSWFEKINSIPINSISIIALLSIIIGLTLAICILLVPNICSRFFNFEDLKFEAMFLMTVLIALLFGFFTISAYYVARKVEEKMRAPIKNFIEFLEHVNTILQKRDSREYKMMVYYPNFKLDKEVESAIGNQVNLKLDSLLANNKNITIIVPVENDRNKFFYKFDPKTRNDVVIKNEIRNKTRLKELVGKGAKIKYFPSDNPLHIFISEKEVVWGAVSAPKACKGFLSSDAEIVDSFETLFNILGEQSKDEEN